MAEADDDVRPATPLEKHESCEGCGFETTDLTCYEDRVRGFGQHGRPDLVLLWLCELCAGSETGTVARYPENRTPEHREILRVICYVGNVILAAVKQSRSSS